jgi:hypothetical protein
MELHTDTARSAARSALDYSQAFDGKGINWHNDEPWPHRIELAQALDWITDIGAMTLNLADRTEKAEAALRDLVEMEDMRLRLRQLHEMGNGTDYETYHKRLPLAWAAARAVLGPNVLSAASPENLLHK